MSKLTAEELQKREDIKTNAMLERAKNKAAAKKKAFDETPEKEKISFIELADIYIKNKYPKTKFNIVSENIDFGAEGVTFADVYTELKFENINTSHHDLETYFRSNKTTKYDPFKDYFTSLKYDGKTDYIQSLADHVNTDNKLFFDSMFKKHLVRTVGQALGDGEFVNRYVLVFKSEKEHLGKSTFIRFLEPFGGDHYTESLGSNPALAMSKNFIFNIEELETFGKADINRLKALISSSSTTERVLYTQVFTKRVRRCSMFASTNEDMFLGGGENSRWIIFDVESIDFGYNDTKKKNAAINIHDVWAQAFYLFNNGFDYDLSLREWTQAKQTNKQYVYLHEIDIYIKELLKPDEMAFATSTQISEYFRLTKGKNFAVTHIGKSMKEAGFERVNKGANYGYRVVTHLGDWIESTNLEIKRTKNTFFNSEIQQGATFNTQENEQENEQKSDGFLPF